MFLQYYSEDKFTGALYQEQFIPLGNYGFFVGKYVIFCFFFFFLFVIFVTINLFILFFVAQSPLFFGFVIDTLSYSIYLFFLSIASVVYVLWKAFGIKRLNKYLNLLYNDYNYRQINRDISLAEAYIEDYYTDIHSYKYLHPKRIEILSHQVALLQKIIRKILCYYSSEIETNRIELQKSYNQVKQLDFDKKTVFLHRLKIQLKTLERIQLQLQDKINTLT